LNFPINAEQRLFLQRGAITESFKWFKVTAKLDPSHYNAFMECAKNMIGRPQEYDASSYIETTLRTREAGLWSDHEILDALFFKGIADFVKGDKEKALEIWKIVHENDQWLFRLCVSLITLNILTLSGRAVITSTITCMPSCRNWIRRLAFTIGMTISSVAIS
jgi:hypothetical protein